MAAIYKISGYLVDPNGQYENSEEFQANVEVVLEQRLDVMPGILHTKGQDIGEWDDDLPINYTDCPEEEYEKYFK